MFQNTNEIVATTVSFTIAVFLLMAISSPIAMSYYESTHFLDTNSYDYWLNSRYLSRLNLVESHLRSNGYVKDYVDDNQLDYICQLVFDLGSQYPSVDPILVLSMIAVESRFDKDAVSGSGARGLMQMMPCYHEDRLIQFLEKDEPYSRDLFFDERLNVVTGYDYISELLKQTSGDKTYALMQYNQGPTSAYDDYVLGGYKGSSYSREILNLREELNDILVPLKEGRD